MINVLLTYSSFSMDGVEAYDELYSKEIYQFTVFVNTI